jgi:hypothetical protein
MGTGQPKALDAASVVGGLTQLVADSEPGAIKSRADSYLVDTVTRILKAHRNHGREGADENSSSGALRIDRPPENGATRLPVCR